MRAYVTLVVLIGLAAAEDYNEGFEGNPYP